MRIHARWWEIAPGAAAQRKPAGFDAADPDARGYDWRSLDTAVALIRSHGMKVMLTVTGPGPLWATASPRLRNPRRFPKASEYAAFARATAARYRRFRGSLPALERAQPAGLAAAAVGVRSGGVCTPVSPHIYRALVRAATPAIHAADPGSEVVIGELAPVGSPPVSESTPLAPLPFLRALGCVDERYRALRSGRCSGFQPVAADAFGYHPHPVRNAPDTPNRDTDEAQFADLDRLFRVLDRLRPRTVGGQRRASHGVRLSDLAARPRDRASR